MDGLSGDCGGQKVKRVRPPGSVPIITVAERGSMRYTFHGGWSLRRRIERRGDAGPALIGFRRPPVVRDGSRLPLVAKADNAGWSIYGAERSQAVHHATGYTTRIWLLGQARSADRRFARGRAESSFT
jgi:hypothetical protein